MTGMKEGAGEDPFAESSDEQRPDERPTEGNDDRAGNSDQSQDSGRQVHIPYKFRRDGVQDGRDRVPLFLMPETKDAERTALRELEDRFGDTVSLTDLREAVVKAGLEDLDSVEQYLEQWGYGMSFDE